MSREDAIWAAEFSRVFSAQLEHLCGGLTQEQEKRFVLVAIRSADGLVAVWKLHRIGDHKGRDTRA